MVPGPVVRVQDQIPEYFSGKGYQVFTHNTVIQEAGFHSTRSRIQLQSAFSMVFEQVMLLQPS
jgi:hypothetical protein